MKVSGVSGERERHRGGEWSSLGVRGPDGVLCKEADEGRGQSRWRLMESNQHSGGESFEVLFELTREQKVENVTVVVRWGGVCGGGSFILVSLVHGAAGTLCLF